LVAVEVDKKEKGEGTGAYRLAGEGKSCGPPDGCCRPEPRATSLREGMVPPEMGGRGVEPLPRPPEPGPLGICDPPG